MATTTVSAILRSNQAYYAQLSDTTSLQFGIAYTCPRYPSLEFANQFREVLIEQSGDVETAFAEAEAYFAGAGVQCYAWVPAADQPIEPMATFLSSKGYRRRDLSAMVVREWVELPAPQDVRVLPARAMPKALHAIHTEEFRMSDSVKQNMLMAAATERFNEPQIDAFLALVDGAPAGHCTLFQVGDIGRIVDLFVVESLRRRGVATALMGHLLRMARRLSMRLTCAEIPSDSVAALTLCERCGLVGDGTTTELVKGSKLKVEG